MGNASTVAELIQEARRNPLRWLIPGVLLQDGIHILHGKEESFKTMLTVQMLEALARGGEFLMREVQGGLRTGIVELEEKPALFGHRLHRFFGCNAPDIRVLPSDRRTLVLSQQSPDRRIGVVEQWANDEGLGVIAIDSAVKLFPPRYDLSKPDLASEVFNQLQRLPTLWLLAHDRKSQQGLSTQPGNDEIVGSGRFAQDPDVVHQMVRPDGRAPKAVFHWGKMREGEKSASLELWFDKQDFRLYPLHPFLHVLQKRPMLESELVAEGERRYGWRERRAREYLASLKQLKDAAGQPAISETLEGHSKRLTLVGNPVTPDGDGEF